MRGAVGNCFVEKLLWIWLWKWRLEILEKGTDCATFTPLLTQLYSGVSEADIGGKSCGVSGVLGGQPLFTCKPSEDWSCKRSDAAVSNTSTTPWGERGRLWSWLHNYPTEITLLPAEVWEPRFTAVWLKSASDTWEFLWLIQGNADSPDSH